MPQLPTDDGYTKRDRIREEVAMKRTSKLLVLSIVAVASMSGVALAASSPTVVTGAATKLTDTTAVLNGQINPNGRTTDYTFSYGPTAAYGAGTPSHSAGAGTKPVAVSQTITGLTPGTVYHYRISAINVSGSSAGADRTFTTTGHPPATVLTGGAVNVGKTFATATGTVNPMGAQTSWVIQYGLSTAYGVETEPAQVLAAVGTPVAVSGQLTGLSPATLFHYRIVAYHGSEAVSLGNDETFFTEPAVRPKPGLRAHTAPGRDKRAPYTFTTTGSVGGAGFIPAPQRCAGNVGIRYYNGRRQVAFVVGPVSSSCTFSVPATFSRLRGPKPAALTVRVDFRGNGYVAPGVRLDHVTAG
jgi:hypothetical protein